MTTPKIIADSAGKYFMVSGPPTDDAPAYVRLSQVRIHWPLVALLTVSFVVVVVGVIAAVVISGK